MAKTEYLKMLDYGECLDALLDRNLSQWSIFELINKAASLLDIDYELEKNSYFIQLIEKIKLKENESLGDYIFNLYGPLSTFVKQTASYIFIEQEEYQKGEPNFEMLDSEIEKIKALQKKLPWDDFPEITLLTEVNDYNGDKSFYGYLNSLIKGGLEERSVLFFKIHYPICNVLSFFGEIQLLSVLLRDLKKSDRPWEQAVPIICQKLEGNRTLPTSVLFGFPFEPNSFDFIKAYNGISDKLFVKNDTIELKRALSDNIGVPTKFILSNIFFDFLFLGGQEYYGYCEYCGKFYLVQRKGTKKYCSDICRAMAFKEKKSS